MKVLFDTSILVAALVKPHPGHEKAVSWLIRAKARQLALIVSSHTIAELYAVLTTLPVSPRISPDMALRLISENIEKTASIVTLAPSDYMKTIQRLKDRGFTGGVVYDALVLAAAVKSGADALLTLNRSDFSRLLTDKGIEIIEP